MDPNTMHCILYSNLKSQQQPSSFEQLLQKTVFWGLLVSNLEKPKTIFLSKIKLSYSMPIGESFTNLKYLFIFFCRIDGSRQKKKSFDLSAGSAEATYWYLKLLKKVSSNRFGIFFVFF